MKKIINHKMYNTETAERLASSSNGYGYDDFRYMEEQLYRKKTGEFFLYGEGGALSCYRRRYGNNSIGGEDIFPLTEDEAKAWVEENCNADIYIQIWGEVEE